MTRRGGWRTPYNAPKLKKSHFTVRKKSKALLSHGVEFFANLSRLFVINTEGKINNLMIII